jgi:transposase InsO family protein
VMTNYRPMPKKEPVSGLSINSVVHAVGEGDVTLPFVVNGVRHTITFTGVWYVPSAQTNLLSVSALTDRGCRVEFTCDSCTVWSHEMKLFTAVKQNQLFIVDISSERAMVSHNTSNQRHIDLWHQRLGHTNEQTIRQMMSSGAVTGMNVTNGMSEVCHGCAMGKMIRQPYPQQATYHATEVLQLVHTDVGQSDVPSWTDKVFYVIFVDDYSRMVWSYVLKRKSEVTAVFTQFKAMMENQTEKRIRTLRSDRGGEYMGYELRNILQQSGIHHQLSMVESPQQNGVAERMNRTLWEKVRCMLQSARMKPQWWAEAMHTATYLHNLLIHTSTSGKTPVELFTGQKPSVEHLRVFWLCVLCTHPT